MKLPKTIAGWLPITGYLILGFISLAGLWAIIERFYNGLMVTHMTQIVPWGFWVALYIYFIGLSAGSFLLSSLIYVFGVKRFEPVGRIALLQALGCMLLALWFILIDLGHPERFYHVLTSWNYTSILAWEVLFYIFYIMIIFAELYYAMRSDIYQQWTGLELPHVEISRNRKWLFILGIIGIPVAIGVHGGTGAIFAVTKARPNWFGGLFPIIFLVSALASGGGLLAFLTALTSRAKEEKVKLLQGLIRLTAGFVCLDLLLVSSEILVTFYGRIQGEVAGWNLTLFGPYWWVFWFIQLGLGGIVPIWILLGRRTGCSAGWLGFAGFAVVAGVLGTRLNIVIPPQIQPMFEAIPGAYLHPRFAYGYFPSGNEWLLGLGTIAIGIWLFLLVKRVLPFEEIKPVQIEENRS